MATSLQAEAPAATPVWAPRPFRVVHRRREAPAVWTLELEPVSGAPLRPIPGQFTMVYAFGVGEVALSVSGDGDGRLTHTVAAVGAVTTAICDSRPGAVLGVRGPLGNGWPLAQARGSDVVVVAGGVGLAPLRGALRYLLEHRGEYGEVVLLYGSRSPASVLFRAEVERFRRRGMSVDVIVDAAGPEWPGRVGFVTELVPRARFDPEATVAMVCGPEVMMLHSARALLDRGVAAENIYVSLERSMRCGIGQCGHCQLGPTIICRDGPVYTYDQVATALRVREL
jgi:anaerobic sulfite reductase subunit B